MDVGKIEQAAQAEVVGQAAVKQVDVGTGGAVLIGRDVAGEGFRVVAGARRRLVVAMAAVVVQGNRREDERHRAGSGDGAGDGQAVQIKAEGVEVFLRKLYALAEAHVGGTDDGKRSLAALGEVGKGRAVVEQAVEFFGEQVAATILRAGEARQVGEGKKLAQHGALQVLLQKFALKAGDGVFAVQAEVGGKYRAAGDAMHKVGFFQKAGGFAVAGDGRRRQNF